MDRILAKIETTYGNLRVGHYFLSKDSHLCKVLMKTHAGGHGKHYYSGFDAKNLITGICFHDMAPSSTRITRVILSDES